MQERHTHMLVGGNCKARIGASDEQEATNDEREHNAIDSNTLKDTQLARKTAHDSGSDNGPSNASWNWQTQSSKNKSTAKQHTTQQNTVSTSTTCSSRALVKHCKDAETTGDIDMNSDHKAAISKDRATNRPQDSTHKTDNKKRKRRRDKKRRKQIN